MAEGDVTPAHHCPKCGGSNFNKYKQCRACVRERTLAWRAANKERLDEYAARYRAEKRDEILAQKKKHWDENKDRLNADKRAKRAADPDPERERQRRRYWREHARIRAQSAASYRRNREVILKRGREWYEANKEKAAAANADYVRRHPEVARRAKRNWKKRNPEAVRAEGRARNLREKLGKLSRGLVQRLYKLQKGKCPCCGKPLGRKYHLDHITPLALGGPHRDDNMQLLRDVCNMQKSKKHPVDFMQGRGFLL